MYCEKCGNTINEEFNFCNKCGNPIKQKLELVNKQRKVDNNTLDNKIYNFTKAKQIGKLNMLIIKTKVNVNEELLLIEENKYYLGFIKGKSKNENIRIKEISNVINKKSMDLIDGIYAIIFAILTLISLNPALLMVTAVCLWTGYGEKIFIHTNKNEKLIIHTQGGELTKELVDLIKFN